MEWMTFLRAHQASKSQSLSIKRCMTIQCPNHRSLHKSKAKSVIETEARGASSIVRRSSLVQCHPGQQSASLENENLIKAIRAIEAAIRISPINPQSNLFCWIAGKIRNRLEQRNCFKERQQLQCQPAKRTLVTRLLSNRTTRTIMLSKRALIVVSSCV